MENEYFEKAPVHRAYFKFALPVVFGMVMTLVYNIVDTYFIARTGNTDLVAGVSISAPIFSLMIALGDIFGLGGSSLISRLFGQKRDEDGKRISVFCFYGALIGGAVVTVILLLFRQPVLRLLGADSRTMTYASQYYTGIALGAPFIIFSLSPNNILRTEGLSRESMLGSVTGSIVNIILDPLFIFGLGWGAAGAAAATVIGNICGDLYYVRVLKKKSRRLSLDPRGFSIHASEILAILSIGIPASITNMMQSLAVTITNRSLLPYGTEAVAAMGIVLKVNMISMMVLIGFAFGPQPLVGYNYGAKNRKRLRETLRFCYLFQCTLAAVLAILLSALAPWLIRIFMDDRTILSLGVPMLRMQQAGMVFAAIVLVTTCTFQATGKALGAFLLSASRQGVIYALVLALSSWLIGYQGIICSQAVSDLLTAVLAVVLFWKFLYGELKEK